MKLMITGPQGCGKTTQAKILAEKLNLCLVKMGDLLRERAQVDDEIGRSLASDLNRGVLVDNTIAANILKEEIIHPKCATGFVVDGFPRSLEQLEVFDPGYDKVFYIEISPDESKRRLLARGRADDTPEAIEQRLKWYFEQTHQVLDYYQKKGILTVIDGMQPIEKVTEDILAKVG